MQRHNQLRTCALKMTIVDNVSSVSVWMDFRGSMNRFRQHQQVRDVMVPGQERLK